MIVVFVLLSMLRIYYRKENFIEKSGDPELLKHVDRSQLTWVDLQFAGETERQIIENFFEINFQSQQEDSELESNSRFYETDRFIYINSAFTKKRENHYENYPVVFYIIDEILITKREADLPEFAETVKKMKRNQADFMNGKEVIEAIFDTKIDLDSDALESISKEIAIVGKTLAKETTNEENVLLKINEYQETTLILREGFVDKLRIISSLIKSRKFSTVSRLTILIKDINSMLELSTFIFKRLEYLQNTLMGLINIEQNKTIKIFTIVSVIFMPPTLIASIYGMNFKIIPELEWNFGYPMALVFIISSSLITLYVFKRKRWI